MVANNNRTRELIQLTKTGNISGTLHHHSGYMLPRACTQSSKVVTYDVYADSILNWAGKGVGRGRVLQWKLIEF